jgi:hypothetical protein
MNPTCGKVIIVSVRNHEGIVSPCLEAALSRHYRRDEADNKKTLEMIGATGIRIKLLPKLSDLSNANEL